MDIQVIRSSIGYKLDGTLLWRINLGKNLNAGPHFTQFMVYDFDGDGKAEMICKTADGTTDGTGVVIGDPIVDYRNANGWVDKGPEFLTVFNGLTGKAMATINYEPARGIYSDWGDSWGNRAERYVNAVAYLDGARPSMIVGRGYYDKLVRAAYDWRNGQLTLRWIFNSKDPNEPANNAYSSQGNHQMTIGDVDGDGKDEMINGSSAIDDDGTRLVEQPQRPRRCVAYERYGPRPARTGDMARAGKPQRIQVITVCG